MGDLVCKHSGVSREPGFLYYVDKQGNMTKTPMARAGKAGKGKKEVLHKCGIKREAGWLYYVDSKCNVCRAKMARPGSKKKKKK